MSTNGTTANEGEGFAKAPPTWPGSRVLARIMGAFEKYEAGFLLNSAPVDDAKLLMHSDDSLLLALEVAAARMLAVLPDNERLAAAAAAVKAMMDTQTKSGHYSRPAVVEKISAAPQLWHAVWSTGHARRMAMVVLSKPTGAGAPERNWADVKAVFDKGKAPTLSARVEKKAKTFGQSRRDPTLSGKLSSCFRDDAWTEEDEVWGGLGLEKWAYADMSALLLHATPRQFFNFIEEPHADLIKNPKAEYGAMLVAKYKGTRFLDENVNEGTYYRIQSDQFTWIGKTKGGWLVICEEMPSSAPSENPAEDKERQRTLELPDATHSHARTSQGGGVRDDPQRATRTSSHTPNSSLNRSPHPT